jgi:hypothetical protein
MQIRCIADRPKFYNDIRHRDLSAHIQGKANGAPK